MASKQDIEDFADKVDKLFQLGKKMHLSDEVILRCAKKSLEMRITPDNPKSLRDRIQRLQSRRVIVSTMTLALALLVLCGTSHPSSEEKISSVIYQLSRWSRLMMVPFLSTTGADEYISKQCAVPNPLYYEEEEDCDRCRDVTEELALKGNPSHVTDTTTNARTVYGVEIVNNAEDENNAAQKTFSFERIILHKSSTSPIRIDNMVDILKRHLDDLRDVTMDCDPVGSVLLTEFAEQHEQMDFNSLTCTWKSRLNLLVSSIMRKIFYRPALVPRDAEIAPSKSLFLDGPGLGMRKIDEGYLDFMYTWYVQGQGERTLEFSPLPECESECEVVRVRTQEGDTVIFPNRLWNVKMTVNGNSTSLAFEGYICL